MHLTLLSTYWWAVLGIVIGVVLVFVAATRTVLTRSTLGARA